MSSARLPPRQVPTLTEVVDVSTQAGTEALDTLVDTPLAEPTAPLAPASLAESGAGLLVDEHFAERVLHDVQVQVDQMLERRLRETLEPALVHLASVMVGEIREQLVHTLRDLVEQAVLQELERYQTR